MWSWRNLLIVVYRLAVNAIGLGFASLFFKHVHISNFCTLLITAAVLSLFNILIKPILTFISMPFLVLTLGLFQVVISGIIILIVSCMVKGFYVDGLWVAIGVGIVVGMINFIFDMFFPIRIDEEF